MGPCFAQIGRKHVSQKVFALTQNGGKGVCTIDVWLGWSTLVLPSLPVFSLTKTSHHSAHSGRGVESGSCGLGARGMQPTSLEQFHVRA